MQSIAIFREIAGNRRSEDGQNADDRRISSLDSTCDLLVQDTMERRALERRCSKNQQRRRLFASFSVFIISVGLIFYGMLAWSGMLDYL